MALANSSKDFLHWNGEYLTWKDFLSHWDMYYTSIAHTLMVEAKEDAVLFAHFLPDPWKPIMMTHIWNDNWTYQQVRSYMDNHITPRSNLVYTLVAAHLAHFE